MNNLSISSGKGTLIAAAALAVWAAPGCGSQGGTYGEFRVIGESGPGGYDEYEETLVGSSTGGSCSGSECGDPSAGADESSTGESCLPADEVECCIDLCSRAAAPVPAGGSFDCPVNQMDYNCGCVGTEYFDCDDFAYACENWAEAQGINVCTYGFWWENPDGSTSGHAINIYEEEYPGPNTRYCFYEPQPGGGTITCWIQPEGDPNPPGFAEDALCAHYGGDCTGDHEVTCDGEHSDHAGEACFTTNAQVCERFQSETGICPHTWEEDYDCTFTHPDGDTVYWSCGDDETCGTSPNECIPVAPPSDSGGPEYESCASINGNNESCFWDCYDGETCGDDCYTCW